MRTYKLNIVYDGSRYQGWQRQSTTQHTVQGILEKTISEVTGRSTQIDGSGRTDSGVHAKGQTASVVLPGKVTEIDFCARLNERLPEDIRVRDMSLVRNGFHARLNAKGKKYEYFVDTREKPDVFTRKYCCHFPYKLDVEAMERAAGYLVGTYDFAGFTDKKEEKSTTRTIYDIIIERQAEKIRIEYYGTGFLYHMVRILTGTLLEVGTGRRSPEDMLEILDRGKREDAGFLAPAHGLFLKEVCY